jgi:hypothetical protein
MNSVKSALMLTQNPPAVEWLFNNLPPYFTDDIAMMACHFCPMRLHPEYVMKQLREHFGPQLQSVVRDGRVVHRLNGSPKFELKSDGSGGRMPILNFDVKSTDNGQRKPIHYFTTSIRSANPNDSELKAVMRNWYEQMALRYFGNVTILPGKKPEGEASPDII